MAQNQLAPVKESDIGKYLQSIAGNLEGYAQRDYNKAAWLKTAMLAIVESPDIRRIIATEPGKASLYHAMRYAAATGLSLNPQEGKAALVPISGKIKYWIMKGGLIDLAQETGTVKFVTADIVKSGDDWRIEKTDSGDSYHFVPARTKRGQVDGYFAAIKLTDGSCHVKYMTFEEISAHRQQFSKSSQMPEDGYGLKTVLKALFRNLNLSSAIHAGIQGDDDAELNFSDVHDDEEIGVTAEVVVEKIAEKAESAPKPNPELQKPAGSQPADGALF